MGKRGNLTRVAYALYLANALSNGGRCISPRTSRPLLRQLLREARKLDRLTGSGRLTQINYLMVMGISSTRRGRDIYRLRRRLVDRINKARRRWLRLVDRVSGAAVVHPQLQRTVTALERRDGDSPNFSIMVNERREGLAGDLVTLIGRRDPCPCGLTWSRYLSSHGINRGWSMPFFCRAYSAFIGPLEGYNHRGEFPTHNNEYLRTNRRNGVRSNFMAYVNVVETETRGLTEDSHPASALSPEDLRDAVRCDMQSCCRSAPIQVLGRARLEPTGRHPMPVGVSSEMFPFYQAARALRVVGRKLDGKDQQ